MMVCAFNKGVTRTRPDTGWSAHHGPRTNLRAVAANSAVELAYVDAFAL